MPAGRALSDSELFFPGSHFLVCRSPYGCLPPGMRAGDGAKASDMMMAARKGKGLSDSDEQGILDDLARLARLEAEDPEEE